MLGAASREIEEQARMVNERMDGVASWREGVLS